MLLHPLRKLGCFLYYKTTENFACVMNHIEEKRQLIKIL